MYSHIILVGLGKLRLCLRPGQSRLWIKSFKYSFMSVKFFLIGALGRHAPPNHPAKFVVPVYQMSDLVLNEYIESPPIHREE